ncbi:MAG: hypothetical protein ACLQPH_16580, partial [Acidimicrobiales bacterium]
MPVALDIDRLLTGRDVTFLPGDPARTSTFAVYERPGAPAHPDRRIQTDVVLVLPAGAGVR